MLTRRGVAVGYRLRMLKRVLGSVVLCLFAGGATFIEAAPRSPHVIATLVAERDAVQPGKPLVAGVRLVMDPGWHTYWHNPGDAGLPTRASWTLPDGFSAGELQWPRPGRFNTGPLVSFGYEEEVLLPVQVRVPDEVAGRQVTLAARVSWLECQQVCVPGKADVALTLPVRHETAPSPEAELFAATRERLPRPADEWRFSTSVGETSIELAVTPPGGVTLEEAYFYPVTRRLLDYSKPQRLRSSESGIVLTLPRDSKGSAVERLEGVLVGRAGHDPVALVVDVPLGD